MSKKGNYNRRNFLLGFFDSNVNKNETRNLNGFVLFKHWDGCSKGWTVDIFTPESYEAMRTRRKESMQEERLL